MKTLRIALSLSLLLPIAGCGFHLRNALVLPADLGPVAVVAPDPYSPLAATLARAFERAGAAAASPDAMKGATTLEIVSEKWADIPIAVDGQGRAQEFSLRYAVVFRMRKSGEVAAGDTGSGGGSDATANDRVFVPQQAVELSRDYIAPPTNSIGRNSERELLIEEMRRDMSAAIMRRVGTALQAPEAARSQP